MIIHHFLSGSNFAFGVEGMAISGGFWNKNHFKVRKLNYSTYVIAIITNTVLGAKDTAANSLLFYTHAPSILNCLIGLGKEGTLHRKLHFSP